MKNYREKCDNLEKLLDYYTKKDVVVAFSGGVDSSLILAAACKHSKCNGTNVYALTIQTRLHPAKEIIDAAKAAKEAGAIHKIIKIDELEAAGIEYNPVDRCYKCKKYMFTEAIKTALELRVEVVLDGTNADDTRQYRPGIKALKELGIESPLMKCDFTKADVRRYAMEYGISVADKPANPCMATRFPYGTKLDYEALCKVEKIENIIKDCGFYNVRARIHDNLVRIEVDRKDIIRLFEYQDKIVNEIKVMGFDYVSVDMEGFRSGSQDVNIIKDKVTIQG